MVQQVLDFGKQLLSLTRDTQQNKEDIKTLREEVREVRRELADYHQELLQVHQTMMQVRQEINQQRLEFMELTRFVERFADELRHHQANAEQERELQQLRLQTILLQYGRGLPSGPVEAEPPES